MHHSIVIRSYCKSGQPLKCELLAHTHEQKYAIVKPQKRSYGAHKGTLMEQQLQMKCNEMLLLGVVLKHFITLWYKAHSSTGRDIQWGRGGGLLSLSMYTGLRGTEFSSVSVQFLPLVFFSVLHYKYLLVQWEKFNSSNNWIKMFHWLLLSITIFSFTS